MDVFDEIRFRRPWRELDLDAQIDRIGAALRLNDVLYLSGLDVEIAYLSQRLLDVPGLLVPPIDAVRAASKPAISAAGLLGMKVPEFIEADAPANDLHAFARKHDWDVWVKGRYHDSRRARSWAMLSEARADLSAHWDMKDCFVQANVAGDERCITFAAFDGNLLGAAMVEKRLITESGKTWGAEVHEPPSEMLSKLTTFVRTVQWTGGGELEFIRDRNGINYIFDLNPRFPAYIHGVTLCGLNLPGALVGHAWATPLPASPIRNAQFARVVMEVPVATGFAMSPLNILPSVDQSIGKHPSAQPQLARGLTRRTAQGESESPPSSCAEIRRLEAIVRPIDRTPQRVPVTDRVKTQIDRMARVRSIPAAVPMLPALSVKTMPDIQLGRAAAAAGMWAEAISANEVRWAVASGGFSPEHVILNGPLAPYILDELEYPIAIAFADSLEALERIPIRKVQRVGVRLRPPFVRSRFGVQLDDAKTFQLLVEAARRIGQTAPLAWHVHLPSDVLGHTRWWAAADACLEWIREIECLASAEADVLDIGGGWHHADFKSVFLRELPQFVSRAAASMKGLQRVVIEPGKAISTDSMVLVTTVVESREARRSRREVVVDASIADLPMSQYQPHRVLWIPDHQSGAKWLHRGEDRILGCICMENDVLAPDVYLPDGVREGDRLIFLDAGAYNASMAWEFGNGLMRGSI